METRLTSLSPCYLPHHYVRPLSTCPFCQRKFTHYHETYLHALETHNQTIDATYTCELCKQVCQNRRGLNVHKTHTHCEWSRSCSIKREREEEKERLCKRARLSDTAGKDDGVWHTPTSSPIKSEFCTLPVPPARLPSPPTHLSEPSPPPAALPLHYPAPSVRLPSPSPVTVTCPVCAETYSREEAEVHISVHDEAIVSAYCDLTEVAKVMVAGMIMELAAVKKCEQ